MQLINLDPVRRFRCGFENWIEINHVADIILEKGDTAFIKTSHSLIKVTCQSWGLRVSIDFTTYSTVAFWGTSWRKAHILSYLDVNRASFERYCRMEKLSFFGEIGRQLVNKNLDQIRADLWLYDDQQVTFKFNKSREYDFVAKDWGSYITPSLFNRLESFNIAVKLSIGNGDIFLVDKNCQSNFAKFIKEHSVEIMSFSSSQNTPIRSF